MAANWGRHLVDMLKAVELIGRPEGATVAELAEGLDVATRTAYRAIGTLQELNFPLYEDDCGLDGRKRWRFHDHFLRKLPNLSVPDLRLTLPELIALSFLRGGGRLFAGTDVGRNIESAYAKLDAFVPAKLAAQLEKVRSLVAASAHFTKSYGDKEQVIEDLTAAMLAQRTALVEYHSFGDDRVKRFRIDPLRFFERDGGLYAFVRATRFGDVRVLAVERIRHLTPTEETFEAPEDFDAEAWLASAFNLNADDPVTVRVRFSAGQARYVRERRWAPNQTIVDQPDGSVVLEMQTSGRWDVKRWVLGYGPDAELLEPADLREEIAADAKATAALYAKAKRRTKRP